MPAARKTLALALASALPAAPALAQLELEEVIVTAQKREQALQDTPISITAFSEVEIDARRITNVRDLSVLAPNTQVAPSPAGSTGATIAIRGSATINPAITWEPVVGLYLDGVFLGKNLGGIFEVAELERVEVLRGPQGTLYGKNTAGGAINLITRKPAAEAGGRVELSLGDYDYFRAGARFDTGGLGGGDEIRANFAYQKAGRDGFYDNEVAGDVDDTPNPFDRPASSSRFSDLDSQVWRADVVADLTDILSARYVFDRTERNQAPTMAQLTHVNPAAFEGFAQVFDVQAAGLEALAMTLPEGAQKAQTLGAVAGLQGLAMGVRSLPQLMDSYVRSHNDVQDAISNDESGFEDSRITGNALHLDLDLGSVGIFGDVHLKSITAKRDMRWKDYLDIDGTNMDLFHSSRDIDYEQFSQEVQWLGSTEILEYVVGLYYFEENADTYNPITFFGLFGFPTEENEYSLESNSSALYGQAEWRAGQLTITAGMRYTDEHKEQTINHPQATTPDGLPAPFMGAADEDWDNFSGSLSVGWDFNDEITGYARYATGWKSGGFNGESPTLDSFRTPYDEETVASFELGLKAQLMDNRLHLNFAAFHNMLDDLQLSVFLGEEGSALSVVENAAEATVQGFEFEGLMRVLDNLTVGFNYGYLNSEYEEYIELGRDVKDERDFPYAPKHTASLAVDWGIAAWDGGRLDLRADWSYNDDYQPYTRPDQNLTSESGGYDVLNASLVLSELPVAGDSTLRLSLWGKNLFDEQYRLNTIPFGFWTASYFGEPRTYGIDARVDF